MGKIKKQKTRESQVSETIKEKFIKYLELNKHLELVFKNRRRMCPDASTSSFKEFVNKYWWKKLNNYISSKFKRDIGEDTWKGVTKDKFFAWYLDKIKKGCYYCEQDGLILPLKKRGFPEKPLGKPRRFLEVDRLNNDLVKGYKKSNCVLACYPCNNAKSNIFDGDEFCIIGKAIKTVWKKYKHKVDY